MHNQGNYPYKDLYPYTNRCLGLSETLVPKEENMDPDWWATLAVSNLQQGDTLSFPKGEITVLSVSESQVVYSFVGLDGTKSEHQASVEALKQSALHTGVKSLLESAYPHYRSNVCLIVERDPAVFRLQSKLGWVISDMLCLSGGNVSYPLLNQPEAVEIREKKTPYHENPEQGAFAF